MPSRQEVGAVSGRGEKWPASLSVGFLFKEMNIGERKEMRGWLWGLVQVMGASSTAVGRTRSGRDIGAAKGGWSLWFWVAPRTGDRSQPGASWVGLDSKLTSRSPACRWDLEARSDSKGG